MYRALLLILFIHIEVKSQFNLYKIDRTIRSGTLEFDCLHLHTASTEIYTFVPYCIRPRHENDLIHSSLVNTHQKNFTFHDLLRLNVTTEQLLSWSASIDLVERYQSYVEGPNSLSTSNEIFFNCTVPWFGPRCQYLFDVEDVSTVLDVVFVTLEAKEDTLYPNHMTNLTCYVHLECNRGGAFICLDWREICDGRMDCLNDGVDEMHCLELEMNECQEDEYRCQNGQCISIEFWKDGAFVLECLDGSDEPELSPITLETCYIRTGFICEEHSCQQGDLPFVCGDGECRPNFYPCASGRDYLLFESMKALGDLSYECWTIMACSTRVIDTIENLSCDEFFSITNDITTYIDQCQNLTQFPAMPVLFSHVRFFYFKIYDRDWDFDKILLPDLICYDEHLCEFLVPSFRDENVTCRYRDEMGLNSNTTYVSWSVIIEKIAPYFVGCSSSYRTTTDFQNSSLYCCKNSSKCISKHRIMDGVRDCFMNDDEEAYELSCLLNQTLRFRCPNKNFSLLQPSSLLSNISTSISPAQQCLPVGDLLNSTMRSFPAIRRVKYYHTLCQMKFDLLCFHDELYMCLCALDHYANCFNIRHNANLTCRHDLYCQNNALCLKDDPTCHSNTVCICTDCFFGDRCQFYAKGIGLILDDILRYEIRPNVTLINQPLSVTINAGLTIIMLIVGLFNSIVCFFTFQTEKSRQVGCGIYLVTSSATSFITMIMMTLKTSLLIFTQTNRSANINVLRWECVYIEVLLKLFVYMDNWLYSCVAIERAYSVFKGATFDKMKSKYIARWIILALPFVIIGSGVHELLGRDLFNDEEENRMWCVTRYSNSIQFYNTFILFFHFLLPFCSNLFSALFIIIMVARRRTTGQHKQKNYKVHLSEQLNEHKHLLISCGILVLLALPRILISLLSGCVKSSYNPWLYLTGYFISFVPIMVARRRTTGQHKQKNYKVHLSEQLNEHKHLLISCGILVLLALPRILISLLSGCVKSSYNPWLYLTGYFISFVPSVITFFVFVLPSKLYKQQLKESITKYQRWICG
ncbi:unnamed protein product [Adineta ricciae]|uniref:G-protein coupled receptors family 1 profile domain-containing protein n=1 Tax=Adineta ricciae TaxID=249248 RepID=A0A814VNW9_ADIRI|nr:unnamed protein product [Adineta ricciae]